MSGAHGRLAANHATEAPSWLGGPAPIRTRAQRAKIAREHQPRLRSATRTHAPVRFEIMVWVLEVKNCESAAILQQITS